TVRDKADLLARYFRQRSDCAEAASALLRLKLEAERQIGAHLSEAVRAGSHVRKRPRGISENQSRAFQRLAAIPRHQFETIVGRITTSGMPVSTRAVLRAAEAFRPHPRMGAKISSASGSEENAGRRAAAVSLATWQGQGDRRLPGRVVGVNPTI